MWLSCLTNIDVVMKFNPNKKVCFVKSIAQHEDVWLWPDFCNPNVQFSCKQSSVAACAWCLLQLTNCFHPIPKWKIAANGGYFCNKNETIMMTHIKQHYWDCSEGIQYKAAWNRSICKISQSGSKPLEGLWGICHSSSQQTWKGQFIQDQRNISNCTWLEV